MKLFVTILLTSATIQPPTTFAFVIPRGSSTTTPSLRDRTVVVGQSTSSSSSSSGSSASTTSTSTNGSTATSKPTKTLGLLTFDLDDTLYPIDKVLNEANLAFARAMNNFGFAGIQPEDIVKSARQIREEMNAKDPQAAAVLTHTEIRLLAIRRAMEKITLERKLKDTADDWATPVSSLSPVVVSHARKYVWFY